MSILWTEDPGGLQSTGSQRVEYGSECVEAYSRGMGQGRLLRGCDILAES